MGTKELFLKLKEIAEEVAKEEGLRIKSIERAPRKSRGLCTYKGEIFIRMHVSESMEERAKILENARTFTHELAHLRHFNHGEEFWEYQKKLCSIFSKKLGMEVIPGRFALR